MINDYANGDNSTGTSNDMGSSNAAVS